MRNKGMAAAAMALGLTCAAAFGGFPAAADETPYDRQINVSASGIVMEVPDMAQISFTVVTDGKEAAETQTENTETVGSVIDALTQLGVVKGSIQTSDYNISPQYDYDKDPATLVGYQVRTTLTVSDQKIEDAGKILSAAVNAGASEIGGIAYTCSTYDEKYQEALTKAVGAAKTKAETLAAASGEKLGKIVTISEGWQDTSARYQESNASGDMLMESAAMDDAKSIPDVDVNPGSLEITANVTVTYEIED